MSLEKQEDDFGKNIQIVVSGDETHLQLSEKIMQKKKALEEVSTQIDKVKEDFKKVNDQRKEKFLDYFNKVNSSLKTMYE